MKLRTCALALLCAAASACSFDLTKVEETEGPAVVADPGLFSFYVDSRPRAPLEVTAHFFPGRRADGKPEPVVDDSLRISGQAHAPVSVKEGSYTYYAVVAFGTSALLEVQAPRLADQREPAAFTVNVPEIPNPDSIVISRGEDIRIDVTGVLPADTLLNWNWTIAVQEPGFDAVLIAFTGRLPPVLRFPATLIPADMPRAIVTVNASAYQEVNAGDRPVPVRIHRQITRQIPVRIVP